MFNDSSIVYVLSNPAMPEYAMIGHVPGNNKQALLDHMRSIFTEDMPHPWYCEYAAVVSPEVVPDPDNTTEKGAQSIKQHTLRQFSAFRSNEDRDFLKNVNVIAVTDFMKEKAHHSQEIKLTAKDYSIIAV